MKTLLSISILLSVCASTFAAQLIPSQLDPNLADAREELYVPWSTPKESSRYWEKFSSDHVPIYKQFGEDNLSRDLYLKNPGIGYWVLGGLTEEQLFKTHKEKLGIDDTLISASEYIDTSGQKLYWALWAPRSRAHVLTDPMSALGITQASIKYGPIEQFVLWTQTLEPINNLITLISILLNLVLLIALAILFIIMFIDRKSAQQGAAANP